MPPSTISANEDHTVEDVRRRIAHNPAQVVLFALQGSRLHSRVLAASLDSIPGVFFPAIIEMFAVSIQYHGTHIVFDTDGYFVVGDMNIAILAISQIAPGFYNTQPASRQKVLDSLPHLYSWTKAAIEWLVQNQGGAEKLIELRGHLLGLIHSAVVVMRDTGKGGLMFIWEKDAYHLIIDLWAQLGECSIKEEAKVASTLMICKSVFFEGVADGTPSNAPENFGEYFLERCRRQFDFDASHVVALANDRVIRASCPPTNVIDNDNHLFVEVELEVLQTITSSPGPAYQHFADNGGIDTLMLVMTSGVKGGLWGIVGHSMVILQRICVRTHSTHVVLAALKNELVENLIAGTLNYQDLEFAAAASLVAFIERILPDALIFRSIFDQCDALQVENEHRDVLCSHPRLGQRWTHLLRLYHERKAFFDRVLRHQLRECDNPKCSAKEIRIRQFSKCAGCEARFYCSKICQKAAWKCHREECHKMRGVRSTSGLGHREIKSVIQLAHHDAQTYISSVFATEPVPTRVVNLHVQYQQHFIGEQGASNTTPTVELLSEDLSVETTQAFEVSRTRSDAGRDPVKALVKTTYWWNNMEQNLYFEANFDAS